MWEIPIISAANSNHCATLELEVVEAEGKESDSRLPSIQFYFVNYFDPSDWITDSFGHLLIIVCASVPERTGLGIAWYLDW